MSKRKHQKHEEEHMDESWLIPYADILTLLLALFIVLFSMSQVDQRKFDQLKAALESVFNGSQGVLMDQSGIMDIGIEIEDSNNTPVNQNIPKDDSLTGFIQEDKRLKEYKARLDTYFEQQGLDNYVTNIINEEGLQITIQEVALFDSGKADLRPEVYPVIEHLSIVLHELDNPVEISGHTDNVPINTPEFPSNWELSTARSLNVLKELLKNKDLQPGRFVIVGYGEYHPIESNQTLEGRAQNRRVELLIRRLYVLP